jgi:hypothetical protein
MAEGNDVRSEKNESSKPQETVPNPPSFYEDDIEKWKKKFSKALKDREYTKQQYQKTQELTCLTRNTNIRGHE